MLTFKKFYRDVSRLLLFRKYISVGGKIHVFSQSPQCVRSPRDEPPATLPLTLSHFGLLGRRAALRFLPADDVLAHCPLPVVGLGHGPGDLLGTAVRHDVDFGCIQRPTIFGTVSWGASWMVWTTGEKNRQKLSYNQIPAVLACLRIRSHRASPRGRGRPSRPSTTGLVRMPNCPWAKDACCMPVAGRMLKTIRGKSDRNTSNILKLMFQKTRNPKEGARSRLLPGKCQCKPRESATAHSPHRQPWGRQTVSGQCGPGWGATGALPLLVGAKCVSDSLEGSRGMTCKGVHCTACDPAIPLLSGHCRQTPARVQLQTVWTGGPILIGPQRCNLNL